MRFKVQTKGRVIVTKVNEIELEAASMNDAIRRAESLFYYDVLNDAEAELCGKITSLVKEIKDIPHN